ncbi:MAG: FHA domain-containing protein [Marinicellaceae bacterium]
MAKLLHKETQEIIILRSQHIFGRHPAGSNTLLNNTESSRLHASIQWNGRDWSIQDTSQNGTFVNAKKIHNGLKNIIKKGDEIHFGSLDSSCWVFINDHEPQSLLVSTDSNAITIELEGIIALPDEDSPQITIYQTSNKQWLYENQTGVSQLTHGSIVSTDESNWYFVSAETLESTNFLDQTQKPKSIEAQFTISQNEEHTSLKLIWNNQKINLGERVHHYLLLILARKHLKDSQAGIKATEQGWLDKDIICEETGLEETHINIQIYRLRKQLMQIQPTAKNLLQIIERRRREIRLAVDIIKIKS